MTYYESAEGEQINAARAKLEVEKHGSLWCDFLEDNGLRAAYDAQEVLNWLGY